MTEEKLNKANELRDNIRNLKKSLNKDIKGVYYYEQIPSKGYIGLDSETLSDINKVISNRLEELSKMTAEQMFKELGYEKRIDFYDNEHFIEYQSKYDERDYLVFSISNEDYSSNLSRITIDIHKAITQQMRELGWLDD